jgi:hypothetical protein
MRLLNALAVVATASAPPGSPIEDRFALADVERENAARKRQLDTSNCSE